MKILFLAFTALFSSTMALAQPNFGEDAFEIRLPSEKGDTLSLTKLRGKIVLLDFWASWCGPCRASNRDLTKIYRKWKDKGFEILGVSLDEEPEKWKKAIKKDKVSWLQVIDPGGWEAPTALNWNIMQLPTSFLIDKEGRVIGMDLAPGELENALIQLLGK